MDHTEYRDALSALGLSQVGGARLLGVDPRTSRRWARGEVDIPEPVARFLRYLVWSGVSLNAVRWAGQREVLPGPE